MFGHFSFPAGVPARPQVAGPYHHTSVTDKGQAHAINFYPAVIFFRALVYIAVNGVYMGKIEWQERALAISVRIIYYVDVAMRRA